MKKTLLITADDYGVHDTIDNGIIKCIDNIDCIDIIVTHETSHKRIQRLLKECEEQIASGKVVLGLHLNLNVGKPLYHDITSSQGRGYLRAISKWRGRRSHEGSEFKHKSVLGIVANIVRILQHTEALKEEVRCQYRAFQAYTNGMVPAHVSSHNGVFSGHPKMYKLLREVCQELGMLPMRCPALIAYDPGADLSVWRKNKQLLLTEKQLNQMKLPIPGTGTVRNWMMDGQRKVFDEDLAAKEVVSTAFFVTHFYLQGSATQFNKIIKWISENEYSRTHSYEMVVHPLHYDRVSDYSDMPRGINVDAVNFKKRKEECKTLSRRSSNWREKIKRKEIEVHRFGTAQV